MPSPSKRLLAPSLNAPGLIVAVNALYALAQAVLTHYHVAWGLSPAQLATIDAFAVAWARTQVTPVADPRDGNGKPLAVSALPSDPTMAELAAWFHDRGVEVKLGTAPATDATGNFLPAAQPNAPGATTGPDPFAAGPTVPVTPGQEYQARAFASSGSPLAVRAVDVMASPQSSPPSEGN